MRVAIFGTGYVGLVTGTCLAEIGHEVTCVDVDASKIDGLNAGIIPIYEPGLESLVKSNLEGGRLRFTTDPTVAMAEAEIAFIAVGTPPDEDGSADLRYVLEVAATIAANLQDSMIVVNKSTVPVGTADRVRSVIDTALAARNAQISYHVVSNPEFLKEGAAVGDFMRPARIVIGADSEEAVDVISRLYAPINRNHDRLVSMNCRSAELVKYAANAMLATKISFMNEMANIAEAVGADIEMVRQGIGSDPRIGWDFIYAGPGYGGSCFPKDVRALARTAASQGLPPRILEAVEAVNEAQKSHVFSLIQRHYDGAPLAGRTFAVWGLSFKPDTDDMREAPSCTLLRQLWDAGANVRAYDPQASREAARIFGERADLVICNSALEAIEGADALVLMTEWKQFRSPDFNALKEQLADRVLFDARNLFSPETVEEAGVTYYGIGRGRSVRTDHGASHRAPRKN